MSKWYVTKIEINKRQIAKKLVANEMWHQNEEFHSQSRRSYNGISGMKSFQIEN